MEAAQEEGVVVAAPRLAARAQHLALRAARRGARARGVLQSPRAYLSHLSVCLRFRRPEMARITFLALAAASVSALAPSDLAVPAGLVETINAGSHAWVADESSAARFAGWTRAQVSRILGSRKAPAALKARHDEWDLTELPRAALPTTFDTRTAFPWAANITSVVRDQSACG